MQAALVDVLNAFIDSALVLAAQRGIPIPDGKLPRRQLQLLLLTSSAFLNMSTADAADVLGIAVNTAEEHKYRSRKNPFVSTFLRLNPAKEDGGLHRPISLGCIKDETQIVHVF